MKWTMLAITCLAVAFFACKKSSDNELIKFKTYKGTFQRTGPGGGDAVAIELTFRKDHSYSGVGTNNRYPVMCSGNYVLKGTDSIDFRDACIYTADFDWTLILMDSYKFEASGDELEISREYSNGNKDIYTLSFK